MASNAQWQSQQLLAAVNFGAEALHLQTQMIGLKSLTELQAHVASGGGAAIVASLVQDGLPQDLAQTLRGFGWSEAALENLRQSLIAAGANSFDARDSGLSARMSSVSSAVALLDDFHDAIRIRVQEIGLTVRELLPIERSGLDAAKVALELLFARNAPSAELDEGLRDLLAECLRLALETNNFPALESDLNYALNAIISFQQFEFGPQGLLDFVGKLQAEPAIGIGTADALRASINQFRAHLAAGSFEAAAGVLSALMQSIVSQRGSTIPNVAADALSGYVSYVRGLLPEYAQRGRMYRAYNPNAHYHFFTVSAYEFSNAVSHGYTDEATGLGGFSVLLTEGAGALPIFRMYNKQTGRHYYTTSVVERDYLVGLVPESNPHFGWRFEKIEGYLYPQLSSDCTEIFRLYNKYSGTHLYTHDSAVVTAVLGIVDSVTGINPWEQHTSFGFAFADPTGGALARAGFQSVRQSSALETEESPNFARWEMSAVDAFASFEPLSQLSLAVDRQPIAPGEASTHLSIADGDRNLPSAEPNRRLPEQIGDLELVFSGWELSR